MGKQPSANMTVLSGVCQRENARIVTCFDGLSRVTVTATNGCRQAARVRRSTESKRYNEPVWFERSGFLGFFFCIFIFQDTIYSLDCTRSVPFSITSSSYENIVLPRRLTGPKCQRNVCPMYCHSFSNSFFFGVFSVFFYVIHTLQDSHQHHRFVTLFSFMVSVFGNCVLPQRQPTISNHFCSVLRYFF